MYKKTLLSVLMIVAISGCAPKPTPENYLQAITIGDVDTLAAIDNQNFKTLPTTIGKAKFPLHHAASNGSYNAIEYFVASGRDVNEKNIQEHNVTPLMMAAKAGDKKAVEQLLNLGANIHEKDSRNNIALSYLTDEHVNVAQLLFDNKIAFDEKNASGYTLLETAKSKPALEKFIQTKISMREKQHRELGYALKHDNTEKVQKYIDDGFDLNTFYVKNRTPLIGAIYHNAPNSFNVLLKSNVDIDKADSDSYTPLYYAVTNNRIEMSKVLLKKGANPDITSDIGWTPLMTAVNKKFTTTVKSLLAAGANPNIKEEDGWTALHFTVNKAKDAKHDLSELAKILVNAGTDINATNNNGSTALRLAVLNNKPATVDALLELKANPDIANNDGWTPLMTAVNNNNIAMVKVLLASDANPNLKEKDGWTALHFTVNNSEDTKHDLSEIALLLVNAGADINAKKNDGYTPLNLAVLSNKSATFKVLLQLKANPDLANDEGWTPLMRAVNSNSTAMVKTLLASGANPNLKEKDGWTALHLTVNDAKNTKHDLSDLAKILVNAGADINATNNNGSTALRLAVSNNKPATFEALLELKANPDIANDDGWTPLMTAVNSNNIAMVKTLLAAGANPNLKSKNGWTALHNTANKHDFDNAEIVKLLVKSKADLTAKTQNTGDTPLHLAAYFGKFNVAQALIMAGADINAVNWKDKKRSALDYAVQKKHYNIASLLRNQNANSGVEQSKYPSQPASKSGYLTCNTKCFNADCYRTFSDGKKIRFRAQQKFNAFTSQWEWDSGTCM
ncbi:MAG: ankyrin repeat domain-containing protein [Moritella sp.]|uniref:ankyrin repeat domain-containing protein n=1 Tax=Moritella sp. TaxID=78556 RepID=UPI0029A38224|nr:ankyrin repeat domain-containing protein [Moritella sp.]MDX2321739.1 ankyrin repeat domain-containing protein [Moritella sp.]